MTLWSRNKDKMGLLAGGKTLFSTAAKKQQGLPALERVNDEAYRVKLEKDVLLVVLVSDKTPVHQLRSRRKRERNSAGANH